MPHLTLHYSSNIQQKVDFIDMFATFHRLLSEKGGVRIGNCKSRALRHDHYYIGDGDRAGAFVHLDVRLLEGRSPELKTKIGDGLLAVLKETYARDPGGCDLQITVEIRDISKESYFKFPGGTLTQ